MKLKNYLSLIIFLLPIQSFGSIPVSIHGAHDSKNDLKKDLKRAVALIYKGPGSCEEGCSEAAADSALKAGFLPQYVGPEAIDENSTPAQVKQLFAAARVWVQPGGVANEAYYSMTPELRDALYDFVQAGGGYVGFCAGAFMATSKIGGTWDAGLGIFPGGTNIYRTATENPDVIFSLEKLTWFGKVRTVYFEGGPFIYGVEDNPQVEKVAYYDDGYLAAARTTSGKGRVFITGAHPEAPRIWSEEDGVRNPEGDTHDLSINMIRWAGNKSAPLN